MLETRTAAAAPVAPHSAPNTPASGTSTSISSPCVQIRSAGRPIETGKDFVQPYTIRMVYGWTKSFPVSIGRPALRIWTHGLEMVVLVPLAGVFGAEWGATGAAAAVLVSSVAFCVYWTFLFLRIRREPRPASASLEAALP